MAKVTCQVIIAEVQESGFFAILLDSTQDISHVDQLSFCVRFVNKKGQVIERFLMFAAIESSTALSLFEVLTSQLKSWNLDLQKCRGQGYDGAACMSGQHSGLQKRIKDENPLALYVHCAAHVLNLVLTDACCSCLEAKNFFGLVQKTYVFFTGSHPRLVILTKAQEECNVPNLRLKKLCDTRWASRVDAVATLRKIYPAIVDALETIEDKETNVLVVSDCHGLLNGLTRFEFIVGLFVWEDLLRHVKCLSDYLQSEKLDLLHGAELISTTMKTLQERRSEESYKKLLEESRKFASKFEIDPVFEKPRLRRRKVMPGEICRDEVEADPEVRFKINFFYTVYDTCLLQMKSRFTDLLLIAKRFAVLQPIHYKDEDAEESLKELAVSYSIDVDPEQTLAEYDVYRRMYFDSWQDMPDSPTTLEEICELFVSTGLEQAFPNLSVLLRISVTLPVSTAGVERSFSRLKLIKTYLRSTMNQERLSNLALLSIENELAESLNYDQVITTFAEMKPRRKQL